MPIWEGRRWVSLFKKACKCIDAGWKIFLVVTMKKRLQPQQFQPCIASVNDWLAQSSAAQDSERALSGLGIVGLCFHGLYHPIPTLHHLYSYPVLYPTTVACIGHLSLLDSSSTRFESASAFRDCASSRARDNFRFRIQSAGERPASPPVS